MASKRVLLIGVGGVGSWCAEALVRTGIRQLTIVDCDTVCLSNVNRQLMATPQTVGQMKVDVLRERLLSIHPMAQITALQQVYNEASADEFELDRYDYVIDAIDSLKDKALLIRNATRSKAVLFSSMGAALKLDPTRVQVAEFWKVKGDPLAAALRRRFKKEQYFPARKFKCVFSDELVPNAGVETAEPELSVSEIGGSQPVQGWRPRKARTNGSLVHITGIFGFTLAGLVVQDIREKYLAGQKTG